MITILAKCCLKLDAVDDFLELALPLVEESRKEAGNISYDLYRDLTDAATFTFIEFWKDQEAIELHNASNHFISFNEKAASCFSAPPEVGLYQKII